MTITAHSSPNFGPRRHGRPPDMIVLHHTAMASAEAAVKRLCDSKAEVSAHYVICEKGVIYQLVDEEMRAWHAGAGQWGAVHDVNSHSIGIELANPGPIAGFPPFPEKQMAALEALLADILKRRDIPAKNIIAHSDIAPLRKFDPGAKFDWRRLALAELAVWPQEDGASNGDFFADAQKFGYAVAGQEDAVLSAFRLRFRPGASGPVDAEDRAIIHDLATRFAVDLSPSAT